MYRFEAIVQNMSFALLDHHHKKVTEYVPDHNCITDMQAKYMYNHTQVYTDILRNSEIVTVKHRLPFNNRSNLSGPQIHGVQSFTR